MPCCLSAYLSCLLVRVLLTGPPRRLLELSRMFGVSIGMFSVRFRRRLFLHFGMLSPGLLLTIFGLFGVVVLRRVYFGLILKLEVLLLLAALPFLAEVCYGFVAGVWEAELLVVQFLVGSIGLARVMLLMCIVLSTLFIPLFLLCFSSVDALSL